MATKLNVQNFKEVTEQDDKPVLVDFYADWCAPCVAIGPMIEDLAKDFEGKAIVGKVNVDESAELGREFQVRSIPTLLIFKNGKEVWRKVGVAGKAELAEELRKLAS